MLLPQAGHRLDPRRLRVSCWEVQVLRSSFRYAQRLHKLLVTPTHNQVVHGQVWLLFHGLLVGELKDKTNPVFLVEIRVPEQSRLVVNLCEVDL